MNELKECTAEYCYNVPPDVHKFFPRIVYQITGNLKEAYRSNCWNSTLKFHGVPVPRRWEYYASMQAWLEANTHECHKPLKYGDIVWIGYGTDDLEHTAVYVGNGWYWHKNGDRVAEFARLERVLEDYDDCDYHFRRVIEGRKNTSQFKNVA